MTLITPFTAFAPQRRPRPADDFDAVDVCEEHVLHVPEHPGEERGIYGAPVYEDQQLVGNGAIESSGADGPFTGIDLSDLEIGGKAEGLRKAGGAGSPDIVLSDYLDRRSRMGEWLRPARDRGHHHIHQLLDAQFLEDGR
jgi:hypothetical protein